MIGKKILIMPFEGIGFRSVNEVLNEVGKLTVPVCFAKDAPEITPLYNDGEVKIEDVLLSI